jgi:AraC-like DNA-binding protein
LIDRFVIRRCLSLIQQGASFKEIALRMGFRDVFAFSRYFKRNIGISPGKWRTRWKI